MSVGLALSGGGIRCVAQLAVMKCLQDWNIKPKLYAGASGGALVACLLSAGRAPDDIMETVKALKLLSLVKLQISRRGLIDVAGSLKVFTEQLPATFEELATPVVISATNMRTGEAEYFSKGSLIAPLLASCCMPVFFSPVLIGQDYYIDAGITNNFPANAIWGKSRFLLGVHTNPVDRHYQAATVRNILERTFLLTINSNVKANKSLCHRVLEPDLLKSVRVFDFSRVEEVYEKTYHWLAPQMRGLAEEIQQYGV